MISKRTAPPGGRKIKTSELTTGVDDTQVLPGTRVARIAEVSSRGPNQAAFLSLTAAGQNLQSHR